MTRYLFIILSLLLLVSNAVASNQGGTRSPFSFGAGARDLSLGGAALAECDDAMAPFWNASRLAKARQYSISGFHCSLYESDVNYEYFGLAIPTLDFGSFGMGIFRLGIGGIEKRDAGDLYIGDIEDNRLAAYLAYARTYSNYDLGISMMFEHHSLDDNTSTSSPGINLSVSRRFQFDDRKLRYLSLSLVGRNIIKPSMEMADESVPSPMSIDLGLSAGIIPNSAWNQKAVFSAGLTKVDYLDPTLGLGFEYNIEDMVMVRGGARDGKLSFGAGIKYKLLSFDYALVDRDLGSLHMFTLSTSFGTPVSEKRKERISRRENEFNQLMQDRLVTLNHDKVAKLTEDGRKLLEDGDVVEAGNCFDRALFIARTSDIDTVAISELAGETRMRIEEAARDRRHARFIDSASVKLESEDYLAARYMASMAMSVKPDSRQARDIIDRADEAIRKLESREEIIKNRLRVADSLLSYGQVDQAQSVLAALSEYAPGNKDVMMALRKATFERWRLIASSAYSGEKFSKSLDALDSALALFPGHEWCLDLKSRIEREMKREASKPVVAAIEKPQPLSPEMQKEVTDAYNTGQNLFKKGQLPEAIKYWERVELLAPDFSSVRSYLVNAYKFVGIDLYSRSLFDEAVKVWKKASDLEPNNEEINGYIKRTEIEIRKIQELSYDQ